MQTLSSGGNKKEADFRSYMTIPVGSLIGQPPDVESQYLEKLPKLPPEKINLLLSPETGAYVRGLVREYGLQQSNSPALSFLILRYAFGEFSEAQFSSVIARELSVQPEQGQKIAKDITENLFSDKSAAAQQPPVAPAPPTQPVAGPVQKSPNVLDLNKEQGPPPPPPIPK